MDSIILNSVMLLNNLNTLVMAQVATNYCCHGILGPHEQSGIITAPTIGLINVRNEPTFSKASQSKASGTQCDTVKQNKDTSNNSDSGEVHYKNYKQVKAICSQQDPDISKAQIYENLLEPFKYEQKVVTTPVTNRETTLYTCKYGHCRKTYNKVWNMIDHVRMHEGIKPYKCEHCQKAFTQKGNLKKHMRQHEFETVDDRRRFECEICHKKYTQRYNLKSHMLVHR
ncbi:unnamed protein product [Moneuplotes crassus]|uniref:C2H2-type domain-containing protein n=1 Tax=Euplotes crassus TaxID=5936 RepID=A0AAD2D954_EUPCR|nr:unnamed protein product [Moneuplotes crassus]